jgi:hypothetical protein
VQLVQNQLARLSVDYDASSKRTQASEGDLTMLG